MGQAERVGNAGGYLSLSRKEQESPSPECLMRHRLTRWLTSFTTFAESHKRSSFTPSSVISLKSSGMSSVRFESLVVLLPVKHF